MYDKPRKHPKKTLFKMDRTCKIRNLYTITLITKFNSLPEFIYREIENELSVFKKHLITFNKSCMPSFLNE